MSRVLRRPMFRGGIADSDGVGITSGLDTPKRGLVDGPGGYAGELSFGERFRMAMEQDNANKKARYDALKSDKSYDLANLFKSNSDEKNEYSPLVQDILGIKDFLKLKGATAVDTLFNVPVNKVSEYVTGYNPGLSAVRQMQQKGDPLFAQYDPDKAYFFNTPTEAKKGTVKENIEYKKEKEKEKVEKLKREEEEEKLKTTTAGTGTGTGVGVGKIEQPQESDTDVMNRYMEMFKSNLAGDKDELKSQRYFELAKFGLNLLSQPGGPPGGKRDLLGAVGRAGVPAIEGLSRISAEEKAAERQAKILGFQAALRELENPSLKKIQTLSKLTGVPESEIAKRELAESAQASNVRQNIIERYASVLQSKDPESNLKIAEEIVGMGKNLTQFQKHKDPNILTGKEKKDQYYYFENPGPGGELVGKWDGKKFLVPGDKGF
jgi:hypothetical protein